jgi:hypothetical protein
MPYSRVLQVKEKERIRKEELRLLREKAAVVAEQRRAHLLAAQEANYSKQQDLLVAAEHARQQEYDGL